MSKHSSEAMEPTALATLDAQTRTLGFPPKPMVRDGKGSKYYRCLVKSLDYKRCQVHLQWEYSFNGSTLWLPFSSDRIWRGSYKHRDWQHQGEGAWKPTALAQKALAAQLASLQKKQEHTVVRSTAGKRHIPNDASVAADPQQAFKRAQLEPVVAAKPAKQIQSSVGATPMLSSRTFLLTRSPRASVSPDTGLISSVAALHWLYEAAASPAAGLDAPAAADSLHLLQTYSDCNKPLARPSAAEVQSVSSKAFSGERDAAPVKDSAGGGCEAVMAAAAAELEADTASTGALRMQNVAGDADQRHVQQTSQAQHLLVAHEPAVQQLKDERLAAKWPAAAGCDCACDRQQPPSPLPQLPHQQLQPVQGQHAGKHSNSCNSELDSMLDTAAAGGDAQMQLASQTGQTQYQHQQAEQQVQQPGKRQKGGTQGRQFQSARLCCGAGSSVIAPVINCQAVQDTHEKQAANSPSALVAHGSTADVNDKRAEACEVVAASSVAVAPKPAVGAAAFEECTDQSLAAGVHGPGSAGPATAAEGQSPALGAATSAAAAALTTHWPEAQLPDWLYWLQHAATSPQAALSAADAVQRLRTARHTRRLWTKAKAQLFSRISPLMPQEPLLDRGAAAGPQQPASSASRPADLMLCPTPAWLSWLQLAAAEPEAVAAGDARSAAQEQEHVATLAGFKQLRARAASREATQKPGLLSEDGMSYLQQCSGSSLLQALRHAAVDPAAAAARVVSQPPSFRARGACSCAIAATQPLQKCAACGVGTSKERTAYGALQGPAMLEQRAAAADAGSTAATWKRVDASKASSRNTCWCNAAAERSRCPVPQSCCYGLSKAGVAAMHMLRHQQIDQYASLELQQDLRGVMLPRQAQYLGISVARACSKLPGGSKTASFQAYARRVRTMNGMRIGTFDKLQDAMHAFDLTNIMLNGRDDAVLHFPAATYPHQEVLAWRDYLGEEVQLLKHS